MSTLGSRTVLLGSFLVAFWLSVYPLPYSLLSVRPEWLTLVLIYWAIALPERVGVFVGFALGLMLDGIEGGLLGENALALCVVAYLCQNLYQRLRMFAVWQQAFVIFVLVGVKQLLCHWLDSMTSPTPADMQFLLPALTSALVWPWLMVMLRGLRRRSGMIKQL